MANWVWIGKPTVLAIHAEQIAEHGGAPELRDEGLLDSALARPKNKAVYEHDADVFSLAAAYAFAISRDHPFVDGNKRTAAVVAELFLELNGYELTADDADCVRMNLALAAGDVSEENLAEWFRRCGKQL